MLCYIYRLWLVYELVYGATDGELFVLIYHNPSCSCSSSQFLYSPAGHIVTGDLNIIQNKQLRDLISKGPKYREPHSFSWKYNFKWIMDSVEEYARKWAKQVEVELDTLSEWVKTVKHHLKRRIYMVSMMIS